MMGCLLVPGWSKDLFYYYQAIGPLHRLNEVQEIQIQQSHEWSEFSIYAFRFMIQNELLFVAERGRGAHLESGRLSGNFHI